MTKPPRKLPKTASIAIPQDGAKLHAPSAARNIEPILQALTPLVPPSGRALEIASGTGEHVARYAAAFPQLQWQPTDIEPARLASIDAWGAGLSNLLPAKHLDASQQGWADRRPLQDLILFSNLLHLISDAEAETVLGEAAQALAPDGLFIVYGPFLRGANFASAADQRFHESLRAQDADIGYKSVQWVQNTLREAELQPAPPIDMPASNLLLVAKKP